MAKSIYLDYCGLHTVKVLSVNATPEQIDNYRDWQKQRLSPVTWPEVTIKITARKYRNPAIDDGEIMTVNAYRLCYPRPNGRVRTAHIDDIISRVSA